MARQLRLKEAGGVIVTQVEPGSGAEETGVQRGDIIQEINGQPVRKLGDYQSAIGKVKKDEVVRLLIKRGDRNLYLAFRSNK
jgi:serine protease Do